ncbi:hypothetical protein GCM10010329_81600 [Streptomyces spiroverticillatus]|uniref:Uncharacterized protein n=1 Tax=Streptomyces finlayi TaxID=67296 RepID=A0A919CFM0_9ACTN|nr:hypothetical protein GCM10010329_81600 [Streptomyces spiroverticillatus]GHD18186.1 hypothetical protein GCM10010334_80680 [Streptomyces finlayi]
MGWVKIVRIVAATKESYAVAHPLFRERNLPVEVRPGQTPAHSRLLIRYTTRRDTITPPGRTGTEHP